MVRETPPQPHPEPLTISEQQAKFNIYHHESGNRYDAINESSGACGVAQALPCAKLPCSLTDVACQDTWFEDYMIGRYTTWAKAWEYWNCIGQCTNNYGTIEKSTTWW